MKSNLLYLLMCSLLLGCASLGSSQAKAAPFFKEIQGSEALESPCINLPFVDQNYPERLVEVTRIHNPKVDAVGAYKIVLDLLKKEKKQKAYVVDTKSVKLCKQSGELGYAFRLIKIQ